MKQQTNNQKQHFCAEVIIKQIVGDFDIKIWENIAMKKLDNFPRFKLTKQTKVMINDCNLMNSDAKQKNGRMLTEDLDSQINKIHENNLIGANKIVQANISQPKVLQKNITLYNPSSSLKSKKNTQSISENKDKKSECRQEQIRISGFEEKHQIQVEIDQIRIKKYRNMEQQRVYLKEKKQKEQKDAYRYKRLSQRANGIKNKIVYDYDGKFYEKKDSKHLDRVRIINLSTQYGRSIKNKKVKMQHPISTKVKPIQKKFKLMIAQRKQDQEEDIYKGRQNSKKMTLQNFFKNQDVIEEGVKIIDSDSQTKMSKKKKPIQIKEMKKEEFKQYSKIKRIKTETQKSNMYQKPHSSFAVDQRGVSQNRYEVSKQRVKTESMKDPSRNSRYSVATRFQKNAGRIIVEHHDLFEQNFM